MNKYIKWILKVLREADDMAKEADVMANGW